MLPTSLSVTELIQQDKLFHDYYSASTRMAELATYPMEILAKYKDISSIEYKIEEEKYYKLSEFRTSLQESLFDKIMTNPEITTEEIYGFIGEYFQNTSSDLNPEYLAKEREFVELIHSKKIGSLSQQLITKYNLEDHTILTTLIPLNSNQ